VFTSQDMPFIFGVMSQYSWLRSKTQDHSSIPFPTPNGRGIAFSIDHQYNQQLVFLFSSWILGIHVDICRFSIVLFCTKFCRRGSDISRNAAWMPLARVGSKRQEAEAPCCCQASFPSYGCGGLFGMRSAVNRGEGVTTAGHCHWMFVGLLQGGYG